MRSMLGVAYMAGFFAAIGLPFVAFGPVGALVLVPTALWLASGLRAQTRRAGNLTDGVVGWPGLTAAVCAAFSFGIVSVGGPATAAVWFAILAACGVLEMTRARVARTDNLRVESRVPLPRP